MSNLVEKSVNPEALEALAGGFSPVSEFCLAGAAILWLEKSKDIDPEWFDEEENDTEFMGLVVKPEGGFLVVGYDKLGSLLYAVSYINLERAVEDGLDDDGFEPAGETFAEFKQYLARL